MVPDRRQALTRQLAVELAGTAVVVGVQLAGYGLIRLIQPYLHRHRVVHIMGASQEVPNAGQDPAASQMQ